MRYAGFPPDSPGASRRAERRGDGLRQQGRLIDVSLGGAAAVVESRPGGSQVEIGIAAQGYSARLLCDLVGSSQVGDETVIHLRFKDLTPPHQAFVRNLVAWLLETEERAS
ncbi:MAG: PilZ domain-containing protein [Dehalococcoidia bacterium]|nr:PilZ domain-containing protein [Dehalococcoidia bacterium]